jgi:uncharacterized protein YqcC (DUF446 family)
MATATAQIRRQIELIEEAMKEAGVWSDHAPEWAHQFNGPSIPDIWQWLQFVYLPMRYEGVPHTPKYLAPQIRPYLNDVITENSLLIQRIIELDSLSSTIKTPVL